MPGNDYFTASLLHFDGTNGSSVITQSSSSTHVFVTSGNAQIATITRQFGTASVSLDGTSSTYVSNQNVTSPVLTPTGDFTIDFWLRFNNLAVTQIPVSKTSVSGPGFGAFAFALGSSNLTFFAGSSFSAWDIASGQIVGIPLLATWQHWAVTRASSVWRLYQSGSLTTTFTSTQTPYTDNVSQSVLVGAQLTNGSPNTANYYNGFCDELRITDGLARWTSSTFTVPTAAYDEWETEWDVQSLDRINQKPSIMGY